MKRTATMDPALIDRAAESLLSLIPLYHAMVFRPPHGISGVKAAQFRVLHLLAHHGIRQMSEIGRRLYISKPYMTALIDAMIEEGFVERQADPNDRRVILIHITGRGKSHLATKAALLKEDLKHHLGALSEHDLELVCMSLQNIRGVLEKLGEEGRP